MAFRDREKERLTKRKSSLFSASACRDGSYNKVPYSFCLADDCSAENLHGSIRSMALDYFEQRAIPWHGGLPKGLQKRVLPSNHLCCSQSTCVNFWFPFSQDPDKLGRVLTDIGYAVDEVLPFELDGRLADGTVPLIAFEWIGAHNYLSETSRGKVTPCWVRTRGEGYTSADFAVRFRQTDGRIRIVLGEWKYTENYARNRSIQVSGSKTDRLQKIYRSSIERRGSQIKLGKIEPEALFYDPFDQLMRQQLLASAMEGAHEMEADIVSLLHVAPKANTELMNRITSPGLVELGHSDIHATWESVVAPDRFKGVYVEDLLEVSTEHTPDSDWAKYMRLRYGDMQ